MAFFSFLKMKKEPKSGIGIEPLKLDVNFPPVEPMKMGLSVPETPEVPSFNLPSTPSFEQPSAFREAESYKGELASKDLSRSMELLSSKLDTIKAMLENLNHRLDKIENAQKKETIKW